MGKKTKPEDMDKLFGEAPAAPKNIATDDFAALFNATELGEELSVGTQLEAEVISVGKEEAFFAIGLPIDGVLPLKDVSEPVTTGDRMRVQVVRIGENSVLLRVANSSASTDVDSLEDAFDMEIPVAGMVTETNKGGFRVKIQGVHAFCPMSQMDLKRVDDAESYVGQKYEFLITQYEAKNIVVSRRKLLELQLAEGEGQFLKNVHEGDIIEARISRIESYGAFAEVAPNIEGLIHISELSWNRLASAYDAVSVGDQVKVRVIRVEDGERLKISLSLKQGGLVDPWSQVDEKHPVGSSCQGVIEKRAPFGLFVNLSEGITGLLPKSMWREAEQASLYDRGQPGDKIAVKVFRIESDQRKLTLSLPGHDDDVDDSWRAYSEKSKNSMGTFADLLKKR